MKFSSALTKEILLFDGAMGTMLQERGLKAGEPPEILNLAQPAWVEEVHRKYVQAGARVLETNTFGGNSVKLAAFGLSAELEKINARAVEIAKKAGGGKAYVAASIGPTGQFLEPLGPLSFQEARDIFKEQAQALAGADVLLFETFSDIKELRAAVIGAREACEVPIIASLTYEPNGRTLLGTSPSAAAVTLSGLGIAAIGMNCGLGPEEAKIIAAEYANITDLPLLIMPNAGLPRLEGNKTVFPAGPQEMAGYMEVFLSLGVTLLGGCCGTTPAHIAAMRAALNRAKSSAAGVGARRALPLPQGLYLSSRTQVVFGGYGRPPLTIGERINPTNRKLLSRELAEGKTTLVRQEAVGQRDAGARLLDVNVGVPQIDETAAMKQAVWAVQRAVACPLVLDSTRAETLEAGLQAADGRVLINSINGEAKALETLLPLAKKYGAAFIALCLDEKGIPPRAEDRLRVARKILRAAKALGLKEQDLAVDTLTLAVSAAPQGPKETLRALALIKTKLGLPTVLGVSNVSFGLPHREHLNAAFLTTALAAGLDLAIINPYKTEVMEAFYASQVLLGQDIGAKQYILRQGLIKPAPRPSDTPLPEGEGPEVRDKTGIKPLEGKGRLYQAVFEGEKERVSELVEESLKGGISPLEIIDSVITSALGEIGELFGKGECYLPQVMMAAEAAQAAFSRLRREIGHAAAFKGRILLATVEGDIHDIGKNIVASLLESNGFEVLDLGKNVPAAEIIRAAQEHKADMIGLSALMTTTMGRMQEVVEAREHRGLKIPVIVGGAVVTADFARKIGSEGYAKDALAAVTLAKNMIAKRD